MPKYIVRVNGQVEINGIVEAASEAEAVEMAENLVFVQVIEMVSLSDIDVLNKPNEVLDLPDEGPSNPGMADDSPFKGRNP